MYSQNNEEKFILEYFNGMSGKFIDIGAFHPFKFSNTRALVEHGWDGVYVEPSPICFKSFVDEYSDNHKLVLLNVGLATQSGNVDFYESNGDAISTTVIAHKDKWERSGANYNKIQAKMVAVSDFERDFCADVDFLNIDVESANFEIFTHFSDTFLSSIKMICIEHDNKFEEIQNRMVGLGFRKLAINAENIILCK